MERNIKVLIIWPDIPGQGEHYLMLQSLEIPYIASILENEGIEVSFLDMRINHYKVNELSKVANLKDVDIVYIQGTVFNHSNLLLISNYIKDINEDLPIVIGGEIATTISEETLNRNKSIDYIIRYDPEITLFKLCKAIFKEIDICEVENIVYRNNHGECISNKIEIPNYDLNTLPMPNRGIYDLESYLKINDEITIASSRGCPGRCKFCVRNKLYKFRSWNFSRIIEEIRYLLEHGFNRFFFADDTFAYSDQRVKDFYDMVQSSKLKFKFACNIRLTDINEEKLSMLKEIGLYRLFVGIETLNRDALKTIDKNVNEKMLKEKISLIKSYGIEVHTSLIVGLPNDNVEDLFYTINKIKEFNPSIVTINAILLMPGTPIYQNPKEYKMIMEDKFWFENDEWITKPSMGSLEIPPNEVYELVKEMYIKFMTND